MKLAPFHLIYMLSLVLLTACSSAEGPVVAPDEPILESPPAQIDQQPPDQIEDSPGPVAGFECVSELGDPGPDTAPFRLAYIDGGNLWVWDEGEEPISLTASGDVREVRLSPSAEQVLFTRYPAGGGVELWSADPDTGEILRLAASDQLTGSIQILDSSYDERWVAFIHAITDKSGELWVAGTDGSGARRLVSQADLMGIIAEPTAQFAQPTGVAWIPGTHTLIYDAHPRFAEEGIYIYVQRQSWKVDADSGQIEVLFPAGEGGSLSFSPDGKQMTIISPENLRLMDLEKGLQHPATMGYAAVGFGEFYFFPPMAWTSGSESLLIAQPGEDAAYDPDVQVDLWSLPVDGSDAAQLARFSGYAPSFILSPDLAKVAYWRPAAPQSNTRELHIASVDGSVDNVYTSGDLIDFLGWSPDSESFVFVFGEADSRQIHLGHICAPPERLEGGESPAEMAWLDSVRFTYRRWDPDSLMIYLATTEGANELLLNLETLSSYDIKVLSPEG